MNQLTPLITLGITATSGASNESASAIQSSDLHAASVPPQSVLWECHTTQSGEINALIELRKRFPTVISQSTVTNRSSVLLQLCIQSRHVG